MGRPVSVLTTDRTAPMPLTAPLPGQSPGLRPVASTYISLIRPGWHPQAAASRAGPGGYGAFWRLRGTPIIATLPVSTSTSTRSMTSVLRLQRPDPASDPISSRSNRPSSPQGGLGIGALPGHRGPERREGPIAAIRGVRARWSAWATTWAQGEVDGDGVATTGRRRPGDSVSSGGSVNSGAGVSTAAVSGPAVGFAPANVSSRKPCAARIALAAARCGMPTSRIRTAAEPATAARPGCVRPTASTAAEVRHPATRRFATNRKVSALGTTSAAATPYMPWPPSRRSRTGSPRAWARGRAGRSGACRERDDRVPGPARSAG